MKIAGLTLEEIAITHKDNELVKGLVSELVKYKKRSEKLIEALGTIEETTMRPDGGYITRKVARRALDQYKDTCTWTHSDLGFVTECHYSTQFGDGMDDICPGCGKKIKVKL